MNKTELEQNIREKETQFKIVKKEHDSLMKELGKMYRELKKMTVGDTPVDLYRYNEPVIMPIKITNGKRREVKENFINKNSELVKKAVLSLSWESKHSRIMLVMLRNTLGYSANTHDRYIYWSFIKFYDTYMERKKDYA